MSTQPASRLYQVAYRHKVDGSVIRCDGYNDAETASQIAHAFNRRYGQDYEYFVHEINLKSLSESQLVELVLAGKLDPAVLRQSL